MNKLQYWIDKDSYLTFVIVEFGLFYFLHLQFIVASNAIYIIIAALASLIVSVFTLTKLERRIKKLLKLWFLFFTTLLMSFFLLSYALSKRFDLKEYRSDITGYYTSRIDGVLFRFQGKTIDKNMPVSEMVKEEGKDFYKNYRMVVSARPILLKVYKIEHLKLEQKEQKRCTAGKGIAN